MGLMEILIINLCLNATCPEDNQTEDPSIARKQFLQGLADELKDQHLVITTLQNPPLSSAEYENNTLKGKGIAFDLINFLQRKYGFTYTVVLPENDIIGDKTRGILGLLANDGAQLSAAFLPVLPRAWNYIDFSTSLDFGEWFVLMRRPKESAAGSGLLAPFTTSVWMLILLSLLVVGPLIHGIILLRTRLCQSDDNELFPLPACIWFVYSALLKQGTTLNPATDSTRILFATWWIFITILTAYYTANLTAFLTLSRFTLPINKPEDIAENHHTWVTRQGNTIQSVTDPELPDTLNPEISKILPRNLARYKANNDTLILQNFVKRNNFMFIREQPVIDYLMYQDYLAKTRENIVESSRCTYVVTTFSVFKIARAFAYPKGFKYRELFDSSLQYIFQSGVLEFLKREGLPDTKICPHNLGSTERQLKNGDLYMTYLIVTGGFVISGIVFLIEVIFTWWYSKNTLTNRHQREGPAIKKSLLNLLHGKGFSEFSSKTHGKNKVIERHLPPPPPYHALFQPPFAYNSNAKKKFINGRDYWVITSVNGETTLVPVRTPSALLFQYTQ